MNHHPEEIEQMWYNKGYNQAKEEDIAIIRERIENDDRFTKQRALLFVIMEDIRGPRKKVD
jgi:hypothetical protein